MRVGAVLLAAGGLVRPGPVGGAQAVELVEPGDVARVVAQEFRVSSGCGTLSAGAFATKFGSSTGGCASVSRARCSREHQGSLGSRARSFRLVWRPTSRCPIRSASTPANVGPGPGDDDMPFRRDAEVSPRSARGSTRRERSARTFMSSAQSASSQSPAVAACHQAKWLGVPNSDTLPRAPWPTAAGCGRNRGPPASRGPLLLGSL